MLVPIIFGMIGLAILFCGVYILKQSAIERVKKEIKDDKNNG
jgi:hypothetical protein